MEANYLLIIFVTHSARIFEVGRKLIPSQLQNYYKKCVSFTKIYFLFNTVTWSRVVLFHPLRDLISSEETANKEVTLSTEMEFWKTFWVQKVKKPQKKNKISIQNTKLNLIYYKIIIEKASSNQIVYGVKGMVLHPWFLVTACFEKNKWSWHFNLGVHCKKKEKILVRKK